MLHQKGRQARARQNTEGWGAAILPKLAIDLHNDLPEVHGFSERNMRRMIQFHQEYPGLFSIWPRPVDQKSGPFGDDLNSATTRDPIGSPPVQGKERATSRGPIANSVRFPAHSRDSQPDLRASGFSAMPRAHAFAQRFLSRVASLSPCALASDTR